MICVTGHRPNKLGGYHPNPLQQVIRSALRERIQIAMNEGAQDFMSGMALGVDQWFAEEVLNLGGKLYCAIPFPSQPLRWPLPAQQQYYKILEKATSVVEVNPDPYAAWKLQARNVYMVNRSDAVIAVWDGSEGGTANCVAYAQVQNKYIYYIDPRNYT